jgi:hypothetical protein
MIGHAACTEDKQHGSQMCSKSYYLYLLEAKTHLLDRGQPCPRCCQSLQPSHSLPPSFQLQLPLWSNHTRTPCRYRNCQQSSKSHDHKAALCARCNRTL